jgi:hypothetical protein
MGKTALAQINSPTELDSVLTAIFSGMNDSFKTNAKAVAIQKVIAMKQQKKHQHNGYFRTIHT